MLNITIGACRACLGASVSKIALGLAEVTLYKENICIGVYM